MVLSNKDVLKIPILSVSKWAEKYGEGVTNAAVNYLMDNDIIDYILLGRFRYVVLTEKTLEYKPIKSNMRDSKNKTKKTLKRKNISHVKK